MNLQRSDILVIGAGISGLSAAAALSARYKVQVLEAEAHPGMHATGRSAALFVRNYGNATIRALNDVAYPALAPFLTRRGVLTVADEGDRTAFDGYLEGSTAQRVSTAEACALFPILQPEAAAFAALEVDASDIDVDGLMSAHRAQLKAAGTEIVTGAKVEGITQRSGDWEVATAGATYAAPILINAAGAWADEVAALAGVQKVGLTPYRRSAAIVPVEADISAWPMVLPATETWYAKPEAGRLMVSPADEDPMPPMDAWPDDMVLAEGLDRFSQAVTLEVTRVTHTWAGLRTFAGDRTPVVGFDPRADGFFWLAGQGGYGVQISPALAQLTAELVAGRKPTLSATVVSALSPERFQNRT